MANAETLLKPRDVAAWLGIHINTVKRLGDRGEITFYRIGTRGDRRYKRSDIEKFLQRRQMGGDGRPSHARGTDEGELVSDA